MLNSGDELHDAVSAAMSTNPPPRANGEMVLVADDQEGVRELLGTVLSTHGYGVLLAADGAEATKLFGANAEHIAAVISDMHMPNLGGESLADAVRHIRPNMPILFMSGLGSGETGQELRPENSKEPFLLKPFRTATLLETLHRMLHEPRPPAA